MIISVQVENWKTYRSFTLDLARGTTFLVASNGIGKTSLIEAVQWALNPAASADPNYMRRGAKETFVELSLQAGDSRVRIKRTLTQGRGKTPSLAVAAWIDDREASADDAFTALAEAWKSQTQFATRAAFLSDRLLDDQEPDLRAHLVRLHSLDRLQDAIGKLKLAIKAATDVADMARKGVAASRTELTAAVAAVEDTLVVLDQRKSVESALRVTLDETTTAAASASAARVAVETHDAWVAATTALAMDAEDVLSGPLPDDIPLVAGLRAAEAAARQQLLQQTDLRARLSERIAALDESLTQLRDAEGECPVCRRPLDDDSRGFAEQRHEHDHAEASRELQTVKVDEATSVAGRLLALLQRADRLGEEPSVPSGDASDLDALEAAVSDAKQRLESAVADVREAELRHADAIALRAGLREPDEADPAARLYERVAALEAAQTGLEATIDEVLHRQIGPVRDEVNRRWEAVFPDRPGLRLDADGHITRTFDDDGEDLGFESFSSGEKVVAKLLLRLATLTKTTALPFCWIDEPLEHLDPDARAYIAQTLAHLGGNSPLEQIFVTTYETQLARELVAESDGRVHLEMLQGVPLFT